MKLPRSLRVFAAIVALLGMLVAQLGIASYTCPMGTAGDVEAMQDMEATMPGCGGMVIDDREPGLCLAHCQQGDQSPENPRVPPVAAVVALGPSALPLVLETGPPVALPEEPRSLLARPTAPALAVRHCCFRI